MDIIGIDPDSVAHGVAIYRNGKLAELRMMTLVEVVKNFFETGKEIMLSIENVSSNNFIYARNQAKIKIQSNIAIKVGRNQQAQQELMRWADYYNIPYQLHKPTKSNWANSKTVFERVTGWKGRSNKDTRSAAYFGYLALNQSQKYSKSRAG